MLTARPGGPLAGTVAVPGDKSISHRALILGAMAEGETRISGLNPGADVAATIAALRALGCSIEERPGAGWTVRGSAWHSPAAPIDCGNSGTTARLLVGAFAGTEGIEATFVGDRSLSARPMGPLVAALRSMGADILGGPTLPLTVRGRRLLGLAYRNLPPSAQVKSALLFAGLAARVSVRVEEPLPTRDHSEILIAEMGGGPLHGIAVTIGGDPSAAAFPLVAAAIVTGSEVTIAEVNVNPRRSGLLRTLERMGAHVSPIEARCLSGEPIADLRLRQAGLRACTVPADEVPALIDEVPALAAACALAEGRSVIRGLGQLRGKECDRLDAIVAGLGDCGVQAWADGDDLVIDGARQVRGGAVDSRGDHRIAMAFLTLGLASAEGVTVSDTGMIATSFPGFDQTMRALGADIS